MNPIRFYEYALISSLRIVLIGMLVGIGDIGTIIAVLGINATMNLFGIVFEIHNQYTKKTNWLAFVYGCFAGIIPTIFIFFNMFAVNAFLQHKKVGPWKDYLFGGESLYNFEFGF